MTNSEQAIREFAEKWMPMVRYKDKERFIECITALISEHYVSKEEYDKLGRLMEQLAESDEKAASELLQQRDELKEALLVAIKVLLPYQDLYNAVVERNAIKLADAAIKNTER